MANIISNPGTAPEACRLLEGAVAGPLERAAAFFQYERFDELPARDDSTNDFVRGIRMMIREYRKFLKRCPCMP